LDYLAIENDWCGHDENPAGSTPLHMVLISCPKKQRDMASHSYLSI
jgi:hypothetical protein